VGAAIAALIWANSPIQDLYVALLGLPASVSLGSLAITKPLLLWINDGLMAIFFLLVGLEIKREVLAGELSTLKQATLPAVAAAGGMAVPALVYAAFNAGDPLLMRGWAIPTATDIAFAIGVLALLGSRLPATLRVFLLALAILDDLGAIVIIAIFYTDKLSIDALIGAVAGISVLVALNRLGVKQLAPYLLTGTFIWVCVLKSGVHATLAGVAIAFAVPMRARDDGASPLSRLQNALHPWVTFAILPLFALANAGVPLAGTSVATALEPLSLGIAAGLVVGKPLGVVVASWLVIRLGLTSLPAGASWPHFIGVAFLTGIGFTMSLFIGTLAFEDSALAAPVRIGVLGGSMISAIAGYAMLRAMTRR
jgi:NhaA family Na+:H+ antiporter